MKDQETVQTLSNSVRRAGASLAAAELGVAKRTLIEWSHGFLSEIHTAAPSASTLSLKFSKQVPFGAFWCVLVPSCEIFIPIFIPISYRFYTDFGQQGRAIR